MTTPLNQVGASCSFNPIPCYARFQWMNHPTVRKTLSKFLRPNTKGRKGYDQVIMFCWLMYRQVQGCSYRDLESMSGIDYSTFVKFRQRLIKKLWFPVIFKTLVSWVVKHQKELKLILDSSFVETYSRKDEIGSEYFGYKEKNGFKLHQIIDYETRLPIIQQATPGARADVIWGLNLIRAAPKSWNVKAFLADKGYDAEYLVMEAKQKWRNAKVGIPIRRVRLSKEPKRLSNVEGQIHNYQTKAKMRTLNKKFLNLRTEIERYFSRKKRVFKLGEEKTRHLKNFRANCYLTSIMEILEWMSGTIQLFTRLFYMIK